MWNPAAALYQNTLKQQCLRVFYFMGSYALLKKREAFRARCHRGKPALV